MSFILRYIYKTVEEMSNHLSDLSDPWSDYICHFFVFVLFHTLLHMVTQKKKKNTDLSFSCESNVLSFDFFKM